MSSYERKVSASGHLGHSSERMPRPAKLGPRGDLEVSKGFVMGICRILQLENGTTTKQIANSYKAIVSVASGRIKKLIHLEWSHPLPGTDASCLSIRLCKAVAVSLSKESCERYKTNPFFLLHVGIWSWRKYSLDCFLDYTKEKL